MSKSTRRHRAPKPVEPSMDEVAQRDFPAVATKADIDESERYYDEMWGIRRRVMLISLSRSRAELLEGFTANDDGPDVLLSMVEEINIYIGHLDDMRKVADTAVARLLCVGHAIIEQGEKP